MSPRRQPSTATQTVHAVARCHPAQAHRRRLVLGRSTRFRPQASPALTGR
ncbi:hypothetical protein [Nostoc linckia]|nr:hypothetical protein [Nostoc linckia]